MAFENPLRAAAAIAPLARAIYVSHCRMDGVNPKPYGHLARHQQRIYEEAAIQVLKGLQPPQTESPLFTFMVDLTKRQFRTPKVIGVIDPSVPWGMPPDPLDARD